MRLLLLILFLAIFGNGFAYAAEEDLLRSRDLDIDIPDINDQFQAPVPITPVPVKPAKPTKNGSESFILKQIIIEGSETYKIKDLYPVFRFFIGKPTTIDGLNNIAARIESYYQKQGWLATRVILPAQSIEKGIVRMRIFEGRIANIVIEGDAGLSAPLLKRALNELKTGRPAKLSDLESALGRLQSLSHIQLRPRLKSSATQTGGVDLIVEIAGRKNYSGLFIISNTSNPSLGTYSASLSSSYNFANTNISLYLSNSILEPKLSFVGRFSYEHKLDFYGSKIGAYLGGNRTKPKAVEIFSETDDKGTSFGVYYVFPNYRSAVFNLETQFSYDLSQRLTLQNGVVNTKGDVNIISLLLSANYRSPWGSYSALGIKIRQGLTEGGGPDSGFRTGQGISIGTPAFGGSFCRVSGGSFIRGACAEGGLAFQRRATWLTANWSHLQPLRIQQGMKPGISLSISGEGQYAINPLVNSERISFGKNNIGRGFASGRISSDHGWGIATELRTSWAHLGIFNQRSLIQDLTLYSFLDFAQVFQKTARDVPKRELISAGAGARVRWVDKFYLDFNWARKLNSPFGTAQAEKGEDDFTFRLYYIF